MSTWFQAQDMAGFRINEVEVERETTQSVWVNGKRCTKKALYEAYRPSWEEAHAWLLEVAGNRVSYARKQLERANTHFGNVKGMKQP